MKTYRGLTAWLKIPDLIGVYVEIDDTDPVWHEGHGIVSSVTLGGSSEEGQYYDVDFVGRTYCRMWKENRYVVREYTAEEALVKLVNKA